MNIRLNRRGQGTTEYAVILAAVVVLAGLLVTAFKGPLKEEFNKIAAGLTNPGGN